MIQLVDRKRIGFWACLLFACMFYFILLLPTFSYAICAGVKIEIQQELTLERQAFNAHMRINNSADVPIEDVAVTVDFADEDGQPVTASSNPDDTNAVFFIRVDTMAQIDNIDGSGSVDPETAADIHWMIIPSPGASNGMARGTLYYVGATLTYTVSGKTETVTVSPDYIFVKPMPQLVLDYFIPNDVYGDDAHTPAVEPAVPFSLGVRVSNRGGGYARLLKIESAQPKIVDNEMGLLIGFRIEGSTVNGQPATQSLLVDFGDIAPHGAGTARWLMSCSLSGQFVEFGADFSHADELGGQLTSLIAQGDVNTHFLVRDVLVDVEGRDVVEDFLARDGSVYTVYESDNVDTVVTDQSASAGLTSLSEGRYTLSTPVTAGFVYAQLADPFNGAMAIQQVMRADGKFIKPANAWLSKTRTGTGPWQYFLNIFDHNSPGSYIVTFQSAAEMPQAPVIAYIPETTQVEGNPVSFTVEATDPNSTIPALSASRMPIGSSFHDQGSGTGIFTWQPAIGQAGRYTVSFNASDGVLSSSRQAVVTVLSANDTDGDNLRDDWEMTHFGSLENDGSADFDGDGISDLDEFLNGLDPTASDSVPTIPEIVFPKNGEHVEQLQPELEIINSLDPEEDPLTYTFEVYDDPAFENRIAAQDDVSPQTGATVWQLPVALADNTPYYWRVKARDATGSSNWTYGRFFVNTQNDPPTAPGISFPADTTTVDSRTPTLEVTQGTDDDQDALTYIFQIFADSEMAEPVASEAVLADAGQGVATWTVPVQLDDETTYYWRTVAVDGDDAQTPSALSQFGVDTLNHAPGAPTSPQPADPSETGDTDMDLIITATADPDGDPLRYLFEIDTVPTFDSADKRISEPIYPDGETAGWHVTDLSDDTWYFWRVKATDGAAHSRWTVARFFVNTINNNPGIPRLKNPADDAWVGTGTPQPAVHRISDSDDDTIRYRFELFADPDLTQPLGYTESATGVWTDPAALETGRRYYWRSQAVDEHGVAGPWSETASFFIKPNTVDIPPQLLFTQPDAALSTNGQTYTITWSDTDPDSNAVIALYYDTDDNGEDGLLIAENIEEDPDDDADTHTWDISSQEGRFYIYAVIADGSTSETFYSPAAITIDHTAPAVTAEPPGGGYADPQTVTLSADETADIYYTLDGSPPDPDAHHYTGPITVTEETVLNYMAVDPAGNVSAVIAETYAIGADEIRVRLSTDKGRSLEGVRVYAFTNAGAYTGTRTTSDADGHAVFNPSDFAAGDYRFRVDYLGQRFWSDTVALPATRSMDVVIAEEPTTITVETAVGPSEGVRVYLFNDSGSYLGTYLITDANGQVSFDLPVGMAFTFRADLFGNPYWSEVATVEGGVANAIPVHAGGGRLDVTVAKTETDPAPITGIRVFLFNTAGNYLGRYAVTDDAGRVHFNVPDGEYRVRADYLGYRFWSADTAVTTDTALSVDIPHQRSRVTVESRFQETESPLENVRVFLFSASDRYVGVRADTDADGTVSFDLPQQPYKVRVDHMGQRYWSPEFTWEDPQIAIPMADARVTVTGGGVPLENVRVFLFSNAGRYLGQRLTTNPAGQVEFRIPEGAYTFRADYQGSRFWSPEVTLTADHRHDVGISTGGGRFVFDLLDQAGNPLANVSCHVFDENDRYMGLRETTDANGQAVFDLSDGTFKIRADHKGDHFWSDIFQVPDVLSAELIIDHTFTEVNVLRAGRPAPNTRVYLFSGEGAYLGHYQETDDQGNAGFDLPSGADFTFRANVLGSQYWSEVTTIPQTGPFQVVVDTGGGSLTLTVHNGGGNAMAGCNVFLFNASDRYLGERRQTDDNGSVAFDLSAGTYKLRVDYLGYHFWTNDIQVDGDMAVTLPIPHQDVTITVQGRFMGTDTPLAGLRVFLFTPTGAYLGQRLESDADGRVRFSLPQQDYQVRVNYLGGEYGSETFNQQNTAVTIPMADAQVTVTGAGMPREAIRVHLFSEAGAYLGVRADTDSNGQADFRIPAGSYNFSADYQRNRYWSGLQSLAADQSNDVVVSVGGGTFTLNIQLDADTPLSGVRAYAYTGSDAYTQLYGATDDLGRIDYDLADGTFKFRVDYLGYRYWSDTISIPDSRETRVEIPHGQLAFTLSGRYLDTLSPLADTQLYLFTEEGRFMGIRQTTDTDGRATFLLPDQVYQIRADYLGGQYWSLPFQSRDTALEIAQGEAVLHVRRDGSDAQGVRVYLFNDAGNYLGRYQVTDGQGMTVFILPAGDYRFRADADGVRRWVEGVTVTSGQSTDLELDMAE